MNEFSWGKFVCPEAIFKNEMTMTKKQRPISEQIYSQLCKVIPGGVNSPVRACTDMGQVPLVADSAFEDLVVDCDGHAYIDYCGSWGALIHGHACKAILDKAYERMQKGTTFGMTSRIEEALAKKVTSLIPSIEKIRFVSSGTESTMSAIRLARGYTGKNYIVKFVGNYHGHADYFLVKAGSGLAGLPSSTSAGIPSELVRQTLCLPYNDIEAVRLLFQNEQYREDIAAIILEPIAANMGVVPATPAFIEELKRLAEKHESLLIFDEVITGFRVGIRGAQELYSIRPDLTCLGKIVGGGFPAAAFGGKKEIMDCLSPLGSVYQAGTLSGNPVAMEAGLQTLALLEQPDFYPVLENKTRVLTDPIEEVIAKKNLQACLQRVGSMFTIFFGKKEVSNMDDVREVDQVTFAKLFRFLFDRGVYIPPSPHEAWFVSAAHRLENLEKTRDLVISFLQALV